MKWKLKSLIQNAVSMLPSSLSYRTYYWIQRRFGGLKHVDPRNDLAAGIEIAKRIKKMGHKVEGNVLFEIGTGRNAMAPLSYWLMGAEKTITIDLNPYLKEELVKESITYISSIKEEIIEAFGDNLSQRRLEKLIKFSQSNYNLASFLTFCHIEYIAPGNAANTSIPPDSIDFHTSHHVLEHIPPTEIKAILKEGNRITKHNGLFVHRIDHSDHFSHSDQSISTINFLQFNEKEWHKLAGNRYMYMNRLREDDYIKLFEAVNHNIMNIESTKDMKALDLVRKGGLKLNPRFGNKDDDTISIVNSWIISQRRG
ncbi:methyltransferase domain-containing protein [Chloroflexota bacterium]